MIENEGEYVRKACAYITNAEGELLVFEGPGHDGLQVPKGTVEASETAREAFYREVAEESGLGALGLTHEIASDVWTRRRSPLKFYVRHFFHTTVHDEREQWTHTVTGEGEEVGVDFEFRWIDPATDHDFALDLDDYVHLLGSPQAPGGASEGYS